MRREGVARDAINLLNNARKDRGFEVSDRVRIAWACDDAEVARALVEHADLVAREVLASRMGALDASVDAQKMELGGEIVRYSIELDT